MGCIGMPIYTRLGDGGETSVIGGVRLPKDHPLIEALGALDELNSLLGYIRSLTEEDYIINLLKEIQVDLYRLSAELACIHSPIVGKKCEDINADDVARLELYIDEIEASIPPLDKFLVVGGSELASLMHYARAVCRRAERRVVSFFKGEGVEGHENVIPYLNRLSDLLFVLARKIGLEEGFEEEYWTP